MRAFSGEEAIFIGNEEMRFMADGFKPGDIVQLKSGGPRMTVMIRGGRIFCTWFTGDKREASSFEPATLVKVPDETRKV
jgi:uncharacterized protein YodC (DUF2158 family)